MNKIFILIFFILIALSSNSNAQSLVSFNCEEDVEKINNKLIEQTPFILKSDTIDKEINEIVNTLYFIKNSDTIKCSYYEYGTECLDEVYKVRCKNTNVYVVLFYEMLVGYQFCIIVKEDSMEIFMSDIFNVDDDDLHELNYESINFCSNTIDFAISGNAQTKKHIRFRKIIQQHNFLNKK